MSAHFTSAIIDFTATNLHGMYEEPDILSPFCTSNYNIVHWTPVTEDVFNSSSLNSKSVKCLMKCYPASGIDSFRRCIGSNDWFADFGVHPSVDELVTKEFYKNKIKHLRKDDSRK